ncbi:Acyl-CoA synthetase (AMP-forming)/AMP-acid ligase II [Propionibacterium cyclohexanicum]|uniref:Acyl-CoA synthetase (AMP-forming)/AMP-acid ligase II n=1 Tax=Propionibacterium cyclohexanicum TaxID=64702 RepID=A0A1H9T3J6_9ACTN|nr:AMP-binding protein [Propionibacterium cyclohexanicum]SER91193.1 Acyl-CoA synthetase (AMP-forming)/AMP-acid ligase II [Propionibacterium cyclohexanicum]
MESAAFRRSHIARTGIDGPGEDPSGDRVSRAARQPTAPLPGSITRWLLSAGADDDIALVEPAGPVSYRKLRAMVAAMAGRLRAAGLPDGARVGVLGSNSAFWVSCYLAAMTRWVAVPLAERMTPGQTRDQIHFAGCRALCVDARHRASHADALSGIVIVTEQDLAEAVADPGRAGAKFTGAECTGAGLTAWTADRDRDAVVVFTSGTTARPKAVRITHRNLWANTRSIVACLQIRRDDRMLVVLPFHYCFGASLLHTHLRAGASLVLCTSFAFPQTAVNLIEARQCTALAGVPSSFQLLLRASDFAAHQLPSLRKIQQAGGRLPEAQLRELMRAQPQSQLFVMYGQTEATARLSVLPPERLADKLGSIGRGIPGVDLEILDERGRRVGPAVVGEIYASGANVSPGYLDDPVASADKFPGGRLRTGDLARMDEEGFIYIVDRRDDFIKSWGRRVSSLEIENCALQMPGILEAAAIGVPDDAAGEAIELFLVPGPAGPLTEARGRGPAGPLTDAQVQGFLRERLPKYMLPRRIHWVPALPMNVNGKVSKASLRQRATEPDGAPMPMETTT